MRNVRDLGFRHAYLFGSASEVHMGAPPTHKKYTIHTHAHTCTHTRNRANTRACTHTHTHTHSHTHVFASMSFLLRLCLWLNNNKVFIRTHTSCKRVIFFSVRFSTLFWLRFLSWLSYDKVLIRTLAHTHTHIGESRRVVTWSWSPPLPHPLQPRPHPLLRRPPPLRRFAFHFIL